MRRTLKCNFGFILVLFVIGCSRPTKEVSHLTILESDTACGETTYRTLEIQLFAPPTPGPTIVQINEGNVSWIDLREGLHDIYLTRM